MEENIGPYCSSKPQISIEQHTSNLLKGSVLRAVSTGTEVPDVLCFAVMTRGFEL